MYKTTNIHNNSISLYLKNQIRKKNVEPRDSPTDSKIQTRTRTPLLTWILEAVDSNLNNARRGTFLLPSFKVSMQVK